MKGARLESHLAADSPPRILADDDILEVTEFPPRAEQVIDRFRKLCAAATALACTVDAEQRKQRLFELAELVAIDHREAVDVLVSVSGVPREEMSRAVGQACKRHDPAGHKEG